MFIFNCLTAIILGSVLCLWAGWNYLAYENIPNLVLIEHAARQEYDYIIVGAGTVGSVLANRLSANENISVLLVEAGRQFGPLSIVPIFAVALQKTHQDWSFLSAAQKYSSRGTINQQQFLPRGKGLGGSSQINYMLHFDGNERDFMEWERLGANGWNYQNMEKYLRKIVNEHKLDDRLPECFNENDDDISNGNLLQTDESDVCLLPTQSSPNLNSSVTSKLMVSMLTVNDTTMVDAFLKAETEMTSENDDWIFRLAKSNVLNGIRWGVYHSYLRPTFQRKNLNILYNTRVRKVMFQNNRASSISVSPELDFKKVHHIHARKEIILSAGAYQTPHILKLSGIGPAKELSTYKIHPIIVDSPQVGENLYDHMNLPIYVSINESMSITKDKILSLTELWNYIMYGQGIFGRFGVTGFISKRNANYGVGIFGAGSIDENVLRDVSNCRQDVFRAQFPLYHNDSQEGLVLLCTCYQPKSRGTVQLINRNPKNLPHINPNYLHSPEDIKCLTAAVRLAVQVMSSETFQNIGAKIHWPKFKDCNNFGPFDEDFVSNNPSDRYLECVLRTAAITSHHPGGTCSIGNLTDSCIDNRLRVRGVSGLRVADASVLPSPISGTPNAVLVAVGEHAADIILSDRLKRD